MSTSRAKNIQIEFEHEFHILIYLRVQREKPEAYTTRVTSEDPEC